MSADFTHSLRRLADCDDSDLPDFAVDEWVCWRTASGNWLVNVPPVGLANLRNHNVVAHDDGTISVVPSVLVGGADHHIVDVGTAERSRHGFIERGVWRDA